MPVRRKTVHLASDQLKVNSEDISGVTIELPSGTEEAERLLQDICVQLTRIQLPYESLPALIRSYQLAIRLLGGDDTWANMELKGYKSRKDVPSYRKWQCQCSVTNSITNALIRSGKFTLEFDNELVFIVSQRTKGWVTTLTSKEKDASGKEITIKQAFSPTEWEITRLLDNLKEDFFDRVSKELITARFGAAVDTIFRAYQQSVNTKLKGLNISNHLETAYRNLSQKNNSSWRAACLACRNVFNDLSKELWKVEGDTYSGMLVEGKPMSVKKNNELNRIRAYMHNKGLDKDDIAVALLHAVYSNASSAKSEMSYEDARSVIINMYLFVAELIRKTDMRPVNKIE